ncbi:MAG: hypothetical protein REJ23_11805 [Brevundimonas sp.]|nr:hypothetical protein [Brevundimonas sp.]
MLASLALVLALNQPAAVPASAADAQVVCENLPRSGSRLTTRVCLARADWAALKTQAEERRAHNRPVIDNRRPGPVGRG